jgi:hypothetical protein
VCIGTFHSSLHWNFTVAPCSILNCYSPFKNKRKLSLEMLSKLSWIREGEKVVNYHTFYLLYCFTYYLGNQLGPYQGEKERHREKLLLLWKYSAGTWFKECKSLFQYRWTCYHWKSCNLKLQMLYHFSVCCYTAYKLGL